MAMEQIKAKMAKLRAEKEEADDLYETAKREKQEVKAEKDQVSLRHG